MQRIGERYNERRGSCSFNTTKSKVHERAPGLGKSRKEERKVRRKE